MTGGGHAYTTTDLDRWPECGRWSSGCSEMHKMEPCWCTDRLRSAKAHPWVLSIMINHFFSHQQQNFAMQISSGAIRCSFNTRFRRVPKGSGADTCWGSGGFRCRYLVRFWRVQVLEGSGADTCWGSRGFRCRYPVEVPEGSSADTLFKFQRVPVQMPGEVLEGSGAGTR